jgi:hypothetical protein
MPQCSPTLHSNKKILIEKKKRLLQKMKTEGKVRINGNRENKTT